MAPRETPSTPVTPVTFKTEIGSVGLSKATLERLMWMIPVIIQVLSLQSALVLLAKRR